jgi:ABC-type glycerol-3-phosphate transport system substrate-binding protein
MKRKVLMMVLIALIASSTLFAGGAKEEGPKELTLLTWNLPHYAEQINGWIADFEALHPDASIEWVDVKGGEWSTYFQTQLAAGDPPDIIDIQGALWYQYAADGVLLDLTDRLAREKDVKNRFYPDLFEAAANYNGSYYLLPLYTPSTVLFYNKPMFKEAGIPGPPKTLEELVDYAQRLTRGERGGFITLNFDWLYWPIFAANGVEILNADKSAAAFNTPAAVRTLETLTMLTDSGAIPAVSWTGRWAEPNGAFGAGQAGMLNAHVTAFNAFSSNSEWANEDTIGVASFPGNYAVPNYHSLGITSTTKYPDLAWDFIKIVTSDKWAQKIVSSLGTLSGNRAADDIALKDPGFRQENPVKVRMFEVERRNMKNLTGMTGLAVDARVKDAVYSNITRAIFGEVSAQKALADAEKSVNAILAE